MIGTISCRLADENRGWKFKSTLLHTRVSRSADIAENRSKSARVRAICDRARTRRAALYQRFAKSGQFLSRRDFASSVDHRPMFARPKRISALRASIRSSLAASKALDSSMRPASACVSFPDGKKCGEGRVKRTKPLVFSADETCDVGFGAGSPVTYLGGSQKAF